MAGKIKNLLLTLGPGILFASTAIGVSHLVQSTRAGAEYGFALLWAVLIANILKYPFFEFGSRYANATGTSLIDGYRKMSKAMLWLYFLITLVSMFVVTAAVGAVTAGFMDNLFGIEQYFGSNSSILTTLALFIICLAALLIGKFKVLDKLIKVIGIVLLISTLIAFCLTLTKGRAPMIEGFEAPDIWSNLPFLIALMGWMPTAVDLSTWNSLWTIERIKESGYKPKLKETLLDFNFGYIVSAVLAICFVTLGAYIIYGTGLEMPENKAAFANQVVNLYTETMGDWSYIIIASAAFSIMFGTCIAVFDGFARAMERTSELLFLSEKNSEKALGDTKFYSGSLIIIGIGAFIIIWQFGSSLISLVDFATILSFLVAPIIAIANFRLVSSRYLSKEFIPPLWLKILSWMGIIFLTGFSIYYMIYKLSL